MNLFLINEIEGMQMTGEEDLSAVLDALTARYPKAGIVMTLGGDGCVYQDASRRFYQDSFRVPVKDTTGGRGHLHRILYRRACIRHGRQGMPDGGVQSRGHCSDKARGIVLHSNEAGSQGH